MTLEILHLGIAARSNSHWLLRAMGETANRTQWTNERDLGPLEGNAQGSEHLLKQRTICFAGGLHLTYATLGAFCKYPWSSRKRQWTGEKFGAFISEETILEKVADATDS